MGDFTQILKDISQHKQKSDQKLLRSRENLTNPVELIEKKNRIIKELRGDKSTMFS